MEASCLVCGLCQGYLWRRQADTERLQDWGETKRCVQTRVMLECEREYQEHLLLSVMPAYIAAEVSLQSGWSLDVLYFPRTPQVWLVLKLQSET